MSEPAGAVLAAEGYEQAAESKSPARSEVKPRHKSAVNAREGIEHCF